MYVAVIVLALAMTVAAFAYMIAEKQAGKDPSTKAWIVIIGSIGIAVFCVRQFFRPTPRLVDERYEDEVEG